MALRIEIEGVVQGVGFRPFVYNLALSLNLKGYVRNDPKGVEIFIEGEKRELFIKELFSKLPPLAKIDSYKVFKEPNRGLKSFRIEKSISQEKRSAFISADMSICKECLRDLFDPKNRRYRYPLINCTNCGPRYTIIKDLPYDRKNTSMAPFKMCKECKEEYNDPKSRFFHAQPIGCNKCGPKLYFHNKEGFEAIKEAASFLQKGEIVAIKGIGGYHLVCRVESADILRKIKRRSKKPFAVMFKDIASIREVCELNETQKRLITSKERPIVILKAKKRFEKAAPDIDRLGVFLPYSPLYYLLFSLIDFPLIVTSANISEEPIIKDEKQIVKFTQNIVYYEREIVRSCDDSVVTEADKKALFYRLSRGYAPLGWKIEKKIPPVLAVGARQKSTIAIGYENNILLSPHIGDIKNIESFEYFKKVIADFLQMYKITPAFVVHDLHPKYETTQFAKSLGCKTLAVQHHLAHIYAAKAEMALNNHPLSNEKFLGFAWDGTGFGEDGKIWGGEVFIDDKRKYHFKYFKIAGGERAIKDIRLIAWSLMRDCGLDAGDRLFNIAYDKNINCFTTSSIGRIFDAVSFIAGLCEFQEYEGYSGLLIEKAYKESKERYEFSIQNGEIQIDFKTLFRDKKEKIATKFLNTLRDIIVKIALQEKLPVLLAGGVFQNKTLLEITAKELRKRDIPYFFQTQTPINDACISLGQIWYWISYFKSHFE